MRQQLHACLITLALFVPSGFAIAQSSQQEKFNLSPAKEQAVTQGLSSQPAQPVPGFQGQVGSKPPDSAAARSLPSDVTAQVPEAKEFLFIKLPDRIVLVDPDSKLVAEIIMGPSTTGGPASSSSPSTDSPSGSSPAR
ncbi:MAG: hypothetical protein QOD94_3125 [Alphaproteobacteria bacterium]|nr:hypothetical protein [Alphaproteobacteria bacterium]